MTKGGGSMDYVFFIIKQHEVFVGEYYKKQIKHVKFKDKDFWEVFDKHDWLEMIDYMNYPMNYKDFKDHKICILYDRPEKYEMLYETKSVFEKAYSVEVGMLLPYLKKGYYEAINVTEDKLEDEIEDKEKSYISYEQSYYKVTRYVEAIEHKAECLVEQVDQWITLAPIKAELEADLEAMEAVDADSCALSTETLCSILHNDQTMLVALGERYPVLAPVTLYREEKKQLKPKFLATNYTIDETSVIKQGKMVEQGSVLFQYTKSVYQLFGKKAIQQLEKKALGCGCYFRYGMPTEDNLWARQGQIIGVVGMEQDTEEAVKVWLKKAGYEKNSTQD